jgi:hypothetical protein
VLLEDSAKFYFRTRGAVALAGAHTERAACPPGNAGAAASPSRSQVSRGVHAELRGAPTSCTGGARARPTGAGARARTTEKPRRAKPVEKTARTYRVPWATCPGRSSRSNEPHSFPCDVAGLAAAESLRRTRRDRASGAGARGPRDTARARRGSHRAPRPSAQRHGGGGLRARSRAGPETMAGGAVSPACRSWSRICCPTLGCPSAAGRG